MDPWEAAAGELATSADVTIIGAGPAGLAAARAVLTRRPATSVVLLEAGDGIGGRVRTRTRDGFLLDRGFQVLNSAYPEVRAQLDVPALRVRPFLSGAAVRHRGRFRLVADPRRHPELAMRTIRSPLGTLAEKLQTVRLALAQRGVSHDSTATADESAAELLERSGTGSFGELMLAPFFRGVFLEHDLATSAQKLRWLLNVFASGPAVLPAGGMGAVARQLAAALPDGIVSLGTRAEALERADGGWDVRAEGGRTVATRCVIVATEQVAAVELLDRLSGGSVQPPAAHVTPTGITHYYALPSPPRHTRPVLLLGTEDDGPITNACMLSNVQDSYAPVGRALLQATVVPTADTPGDATALEQQVRAQLRAWFGDDTTQWEHLHTDRLESCLPFAAPGTYGAARDPRVDAGLLVCGDHVDGATLDGALRSGRLAGEAAASALAS